MSRIDNAGTSRHSAITVLVIDSMQRFWFFRRVAHSLRTENKFVFFCSEPLAAVIARFLGYKSIYVRRDQLGDGSLSTVEQISKCIEVLNGDISERDAARDFSAIIRSLHKLVETYPVATVVVWNGQQLFARASAVGAKQKDIPIRFLEIANLPGMIFADPEGVNASSLLASRPNILDGLPSVDESIHQKWISDYEQSKANPPPQSRITLSQKISSIINFLLKKVTAGVCQRSMSSLKRSVPARSHPKSERISREDLKDLSYIFLPLQVCGDTQLKLHSTIDNVAAVRIAHAKASELGSELLVKIHPAEFDNALLSSITELQKELGFRLISGPITDVIKFSKLVVTINSTVGLEALIYDVNLLTLGNSFYKDFDKERLRNYLHHFLIPAHYFENTPVSVGSARRIIGTK